MPTLDLPTKYLSILQRILAELAPQAELWAYGSRVTGKAHEGSDLDLVVRYPIGAERSSLAALRAALSDSDIPILVDVHDWDRIPQEFCSEIEKTHVVIQRPRTAVAAATSVV
jgi:predicted nucleotidyltransferase